MTELQTTTAAPATPLGYRVDWWYRHASDEDQSIRQLWQMSSGAKSADDITAECAGLRSQGYTVQRIRVELVCPACRGNARILVRVFKRKPAKYAECKVCGGNGCVGEPLDWPLPQPHETVLV